ncbi:MAG: M43 family zinc metalloprotease [bacterium]
MTELRKSAMLFLAVVCGCLFLVGPLTAASGYDRDRAIDEGLYEIPARGPNWCGNTILMERWLAEQKDKTGESALELPYCATNGPCDVASTRDNYYPGSYPEIYFIRLVVHVFAYDDGSGPCASESDVLAMVDRMNDDFRPAGIQFEIQNIEEVWVTDYLNLYFDNSSADSTMKLLYSTSPSNTMNMYIVNIVSSEGDILGYSYLPHQFALNYRSGCVIDETVVSYADATASHESGHFFGLHHTFRGVDEVTACSGCYEEPQGGQTNNDAVGDYCSDTPPTPTNFTCDPPGGTDACSGFPWGLTQVENYMGYSADYCQEFFTQQQYARMRCWFLDELLPLNIPDVDGDDVLNAADNCPHVANTDQLDVDGDTVGNVCDNCMNTPNRDQADYDNDGIGDVCDDCTDSDDDGYGDPGFALNTCTDDNCPYIFNPGQEDNDNDLLGNLCDNCPDDYNPGQEDEWDDGVGDLCDGYVHIYPDDLPDTIYKSQPFEYFFHAVGAEPPYSWFKQGGDLPLGTYFEGGTVGRIYGTPNWNSTYYFTIRCADSGSPTQSDTVYNLRIVVTDAPPPDYICGDCNDDEIANITDAVYLVNYIFNFGPAPIPLAAGDVNCDGVPNITDAVYLIQFIFSDGPPPCDPNNDGTPDC